MDWKNKITQYLPIACLLAACQNPAHPPAVPDLIVHYPVALREKPGEKSPESAQLPVGAMLTDSRQASPFVSTIALNDTLWQEPWLLVTTAEGQQGWVYGAAVNPLRAGAAEIRKWRLAKRFEAWFGPGLEAQWQAWLNMATPADTAMAAWWRTGLRLQDTLNLLIARRVTPEAGHPIPDLFWLNEMTPCLIVQRLAAGAQYSLFANYAALSQRAAVSAGSQDDLYFEACIAAFPVDSIESDFPAWVFPLSAERSCSNLGSGAHLRLLKAIDRASLSGDLFRPELNALKDKILSDILDQARSYWQSREKILDELYQIQKAPLRCLDSRDRSALAARMAMLRSAAANGIQINLRNGQ